MCDCILAIEMTTDSAGGHSKPAKGCRAPDQYSHRSTHERAPQLEISPIKEKDPDHRKTPGLADSQPTTHYDTS